jgi:multiple sugar transport system substrate-binding protein
LAALCGLVLLAAGCGSDEGPGSGPTELTWFIFNEPSGAPQAVAERCSQESNGEFTIEFEYLPSDADSQREQLVRRLGAEDDSIDIMGMDVIWTGEFANAGWTVPVPDDTEQAVTQDVFNSVLETGTFEDELYAVPIWSNTQLLWYRTDRVDRPPATWDEMIDEAERIGPEEGQIQVQANFYEGLTVWVNALVESAGTTILNEEGTAVVLEQGPTEEALAIMGRLSRSPVADPAITTSDEDTSRLGFQAGSAAFMINYPFVFPSAEAEAPDVAKLMEAAKYPKVVDDQPSAPPLGGINLGVSAFSPNQDVAWDAVECLVQPQNQLEIASTGGLPPVSESVYDSKEIDKVYPGYAEVIRKSIDTAVPRPAQSPAYQDITQAIQRAVHPTDKIDPADPTPVYEELGEGVDQAIGREGLL